MKKLIAGLIAALLSVFIASVSVVAQSADSFSSNSVTTTATHTGTGMMENHYAWKIVLGVIIIAVIGVGLIRRNRRNNDAGMRKGPESDSGISNPAGGI